MNKERMMEKGIKYGSITLIIIILGIYLAITPTVVSDDFPITTPEKIVLSVSMSGGLKTYIFDPQRETIAAYT